MRGIPRDHQHDTNRTGKGTIINKWKNLQIYKQKTQDKLIPEHIRINTKHDNIFKTPNIGNTQKTKLYTTQIHNNTNINNQKRTGIHSNNQPGYKCSTRQKLSWLRMGKLFDARNMFQGRKNTS